MEIPIKCVGVAKSGQLKENIHKYHSKIFENKRSGKTKHLLNEELLHQNVYLPSSKQTGFLTSRPLIFLEAFEQLLATGQFSSEWLNVPDDKGLYFECIIPLYEQTVKKVTIHVYLSTGVILFKGTDHDAWPRKYLPQILDAVNEISSSGDIKNFESQIILNTPAMPAETETIPVCQMPAETETIPACQINNANATTSDITQHEIDMTIATVSDDMDELNVILDSAPDKLSEADPPIENTLVQADSPDFLLPTPPVTEVKSQMNTKLNSKINYNTSNTAPNHNDHHNGSESYIGIPELEIQLKGLWAENKNVRTAVSTLDNGLQNVNKTLGGIQDALTEQKDKFDNMLVAFDKKFDIKLETFISAMNDSMDKKIKKATSEVHTKLQKEIAEIKDVVGAHKIHTENRLKKISEHRIEAYAEQINGEIEMINSKLNDIDTTSINKWSSEIDNLAVEQANIIKSFEKITAVNCNQEIKNIKIELKNSAARVQSLEQILEDLDLTNMHLRYNQLSVINKEVSTLKNKYDKPVCDLFQQVNAINEKLNNILFPQSSHLRQENIVRHDATACLETVAPQLLQSSPTALNSNLTTTTNLQRQAMPLSSQYQPTNSAHNPRVGFSQQTPHSAGYIMSSKYSMCPDVSRTEESESVLSANNNNSHSEGRNQQVNNREIMILMDSNRKVIDFKRLWKSENSEVFAAPTLADAYDTLVRSNNRGLSCIFLHCATNDMESKSTENILELFKRITDLIKNKFQAAKIILSEILIRNDHLDEMGSRINSHLNHIYRDDEKVLIIRHGNIRREGIRVLRDSKHLLPSISPLFASNIQRGLKKVCPRKSYTRTNEENINKYVPSRNSDQRPLQHQPNENVVHTRNFDKENFCAGLIQAIQTFVGSF